MQNVGCSFNPKKGALYKDTAIKRSLLPAFVSGRQAGDGLGLSWETGSAVPEAKHCNLDVSFCHTFYMFAYCGGLVVEIQPLKC